DETFERAGGLAHLVASLAINSRGILLKLFECFVGNVFGNGAHSQHVFRHRTCLLGKSLARRSIVSRAGDGTIRIRFQVDRSHAIPFKTTSVPAYRKSAL